MPTNSDHVSGRGVPKSWKRGRAQSLRYVSTNSSQLSFSHTCTHQCTQFDHIVAGRNGGQWEECLSKAAYWAKVTPYYIKKGLVSEVTKGWRTERAFAQMLCHDCHTVHKAKLDKQNHTYGKPSKKSRLSAQTD